MTFELGSATELVDRQRRDLGHLAAHRIGRRPEPGIPDYVYGVPMPLPGTLAERIPSWNRSGDSNVPQLSKLD